MQILADIFGHNFVPVSFTNRTYYVGGKDGSLGKIDIFNFGVGQMRNSTPPKVLLGRWDLPPVQTKLKYQIMDGKNRLGFPQSFGIAEISFKIIWYKPGLPIMTLH